MAPYDRKYDEKRDFYRMMVNATVTITVPGSSETYTGETEDLSANGIQFITDSHLKVGQTIQVIVEPVGRKNAPLQGDVDIKRVDVTKEGRFVVAGYMTNVR